MIAKWLAKRKRMAELRAWRRLNSRASRDKAQYVDWVYQRTQQMWRHGQQAVGFAVLCQWFRRLSK